MSTVVVSLMTVSFNTIFKLILHVNDVLSLVAQPQAVSDDDVKSVSVMKMSFYTIFVKMTTISVSVMTVPF